MKTKEKIVILSLLMFFSTNGIMNAQTIDDAETYPTVGIGARYMPTITMLDYKSVNSGVVETEFLLGYGVGGVLEFNFSKNIGVQGEFIYNSLSQKYKDEGVTRKVNIDYINVPLMLSLNTNRGRRVNLNICGGPQFGLNVGAKVSTSGDTPQDTVNAVVAVKKSDFGFAYGAGLEFSNSSKTLRFDFGFRGVYGLVDVSDDSRTTETSSYYILDKTNIETYSLYVGLTLLF